MRSQLGEFEGPLFELEGLAQTMLHAAQTPSRIEAAALNFLACRCHDLWGELQVAWQSAWEALPEQEAANV